MIKNTHIISGVPSNPVEAVRTNFELGSAKTFAEIMDSDEFKETVEQFHIEAECETLSTIDTSIFISAPPEIDIRNAIVDLVWQRDRLSENSYRDEVIKMAIKFSTVDADFPTWKVPVDTDNIPRATDWQKRALALLIRGVYFYPVSLVKTSSDKLATNFNAQFNQRDNMEQYDRFKAGLAEGNAQNWAQEHCFTRLGLTVYPYLADKPLLSGLGDVKKAMYDAVLNASEKNKPHEERTFNPFIRAIGIYRKQWPVLSTTKIYGSWVRGMTAIIVSFDEHILKGSDNWISTMLTEMEDPSYNLLYEDNKDSDGVLSIGYRSPSDYTAKHNWQGNRFHQNAIVSFAKNWNKILEKNKKLAKTIPKLDEAQIQLLELVPSTKMAKMLPKS